MAVTDASGTLISQQRYLPFGGVREDVGNISQTDYGYTGQRNLDSGIGLMDYKARFFPPYINRFIQPDTIIPDPYNPQDLNRFVYVRNNSLNYVDPSGHVICNDEGVCFTPPPNTGIIREDSGSTSSGSGSTSNSGSSGEGGGRGNSGGNGTSPGKIDYVTGSFGVSVPSLMILPGGLLCMSAALCVVGAPVAEAGMSLYLTPANALTLGPAYTQDRYGNAYISFQVAVGKNLPGTPIGFQVITHKINSSTDYVTEGEARNFITRWNIAGNTIGFPGLSGARIPPSGGSINPSSGETSTMGTFFGTVIAEVSVSYTVELPFDILPSTTPWGN